MLGFVSFNSLLGGSLFILALDQKAHCLVTLLEQDRDLHDAELPNVMR